MQGKGELMAGFTGEFEKLYRLLEKSHSSEQRMANKTKTMLADIHKKQYVSPACASKPASQLH